MTVDAAVSLPSPNGAPILSTKLHIPRVPSETVVRERLIERINRGLEHKVTYLCAPAGFGKSTLLEQWARQAGSRPAWYSVDRGDNEIARFWRYVAAAIDTVRPGFLAGTEDAIKLVQPALYEVAVTMLINELERLEKPIVLVLDDLHVITEGPLLDSLAFFIEYLPESVHLIVASRAEPAFPAARMRSRQWMTVLDTSDLRFTKREGSEFYGNCMRLGLPDEDVGDLVRRTEGWITAMKLAALSLRADEHTAMRLQHFSGASQLMEQYLLEEVYAQQSAHVQRFLMECSILNRMNAPLCRAVTGIDASWAILSKLKTEQLFLISLDEREGWYRFHHLFGEFLHHQLERIAPERISELLLNAGKWCEREGLKEEALDYYMNGRHYESAIRLLEEMTETASRYLRVSPAWLIAQFSRIPESMLTAHPFLYFSYVHVILMGEKNYAKAEKMLIYAEQRYKAAEDRWTEESRNDFWGTYYFLQMLYATEVTRDHEQAVHYMRLSKQYKPAGTRLIFAQEKTVDGPSIIWKHMQGERSLKGRAMIIPFLNQLIQILDGIEMVGTLKICLAEALYEYNELGEARAIAKEVLDTAFLGDRNYIPEILLPARLVAARIQRAEGRTEEAKTTLRRTRRDIIDLGMTGSLIYCEAELALLALEEGDGGPAESWLAFYRLSGSDEIDARTLHQHHCLFRIYAAQNRDEEALRLCDRLLETVEREKREHLLIELGVTQAVLLHRTGRTEEALIRLMHLLYIAEMHDFARTFFQAGEPLAELLAALIESWDRLKHEFRPSMNYARMLLAGFGGVDEREPTSNLSLILTRKEQEVFRMIARNKTNKEIATELGIRYETVRTHIRNIYSKLMVSTREEAIREGQRHGL